MKTLITLAALCCALSLPACGGGTTPAPDAQQAAALPQGVAVSAPLATPNTLQCNGTPKRAIVYLHSWGATHEEVMKYNAIINAPDACIISPSFGEMMPNSIYGTQQAINDIDTAVHYVMELTHTSQVQMVAVSGGTAPAQTYIYQHPGTVQVASLWFPIFDLQFLYEETSLQRLRDDMLTIIGHAPRWSMDLDYRERSPSRQMGMLGEKLHLNVGTLDTVVPGDQTGMLLIHASNAVVHSWPINHTFGEEQAADAMQQLQQ